MPLCLGILAHVDAGKTTMSEQILYRTGAARTLGRVDDKTSRLDHDETERQRGITIFSDSASFSFDGRDFCLLDTPGHADFFAQTERSLWALDAAVLLISVPEGVRGHTLTLWNLLEKQGVPTLLFLNKTDQPGADAAGLFPQLEKRLSPNLVCMNGFNGSFSPVQREALAGLDEALCDAFLTENFDEAFWRSRAGALFTKRSWFPVLSGSALAGDGVESLLSLLALCPEKPPREGGPAGFFFQVRHDEKNTPYGVFRLTRGVLRPQDTVCFQDGTAVKITQLKSIQGGRLSPLDEVRAGEIAALTPLSENVLPGSGFGGEKDRALEQAVPLLTVRADCPKEKSLPECLAVFHRLEREEPSLSVQPVGSSLTLRSMGAIQLEVLQSFLERREDMRVSFSPPEILYQETIAAPVLGCGHYEPLRHYAEVHLRLEPGARGRGITFESAVSTDVLEQNWQNLIRTHVLEAPIVGVLTGSPVTDLHVVLTAGRAHLKHTEGGDFRQATYRALRQGLFKADCVLLEPMYEYRLLIPPSAAGRVSSLLAGLHGSFSSECADEDTAAFSGAAPVAQLLPILEKLPALSAGQGSAEVRFRGFAPCHNSEQVMARRGYDPACDFDHPADSIFCSHGAGFTVSWREADEYMHLPL